MGQKHAGKCDVLWVICGTVAVLGFNLLMIGAITAVIVLVVRALI